MEVQKIKVKVADDPEYFKRYYKANIGKFQERAELRKLITINCACCNKQVPKKHMKEHNSTKRHQAKEAEIKQLQADELNVIEYI